MYKQMGKSLQVPASLVVCFQDIFLCPLLFILNINNIKGCAKDLKFIQVADDSTLYAKGKPLSDLAAKINTELHTVVRWHQINRVYLNVSESFFTVFSSFSQVKLPDFSIKGISQVHSPTRKFLGILVDKKLNFAPHI